MNRVVNSFALLGDEEDDDVTVLVEHFAKKVGLPAADSTAKDQSGKGNGYSVYIGNLPSDATIDHVGHKFSEFGDIKHSGIQVRSSKGFCFGFVQFESFSSAQKALEASPVLIGNQNVFVEEKRVSRVVTDRGSGALGPGPRGGFRRNEAERFGNEQEYSPRRNYFDGPNGNGRGGSKGRGHGRGFNNDNVVRDEKEGSAGNGYTNGNGAVGWEQSGNNHVRSYRNDSRSFQSGNRNYSGERRGGYGGNDGMNYGGERRGNGNGGNHVCWERRDGKNNGSHEQSSNGEVKETANGAVDSESSKVISEGDASPVTEEPREIVAKEKPQGKFPKAEDEFAKKKQEEYQKWLIQYRTWKTLGEYEKEVAEKRKALEALKNEERKVAADKDFEAMKLVEKKKKDAALLVSCQLVSHLSSKDKEAPKLKKKDSLDKDVKSRKALSIVEFLKPAHGSSSYNHGSRRGHDVRSEDRSEPGLEQGGSKKGSSEGPIIPIDDQGEFPDLKGAARAL